MTTIPELIASKVRTAKVSLTEEDERRIKAGLRAAGIEDQIDPKDMHVANTILDRAMARMQASSTPVTLCPRCQGPTSSVKLATRKSGNYCTNCRVVTPA
jgi:formamidopyrimidine-DNA glycosylase